MDYHIYGDQGGEVVRLKTLSADPATPFALFRDAYPKADGWYEKDDAGVVRKFMTGPSGGGGAPAGAIAFGDPAGSGSLAFDSANLSWNDASNILTVKSFFQFDQGTAGSNIPFSAKSIFSGAAINSTVSRFESAITADQDWAAKLIGFEGKAIWQTAGAARTLQKGIGVRGNVESNPAGAGDTITDSLCFAALYTNTLGTTGTLALYGVDVLTLTAGAVTTCVGLDLPTLIGTTRMSFRSADTTATMRHAGFIMSGSSTVAPVAHYDALVAAGTAGLKLDAFTTPHTSTTGVIDMDLQTSTANVTGILLSTSIEADVTGIAGIKSSLQIDVNLTGTNKARCYTATITGDAGVTALAIGYEVEPPSNMGAASDIRGFSLDNNNYALATTQFDYGVFMRQIAQLNSGTDSFIPVSITRGSNRTGAGAGTVTVSNPFIDLTLSLIEAGGGNNVSTATFFRGVMSVDANSNTVSGNLVSLSLDGPIAAASTLQAYHVVDSGVVNQAGATLRGMLIDFSASAVTAGTLEGVKITLPAVYGAATEKGLTMTGDGGTLDLVTDTLVVDASKLFTGAGVTHRTGLFTATIQEAVAHDASTLVALDALVSWETSSATADLGVAVGVRSRINSAGASTGANITSAFCFQADYSHLDGTTGTLSLYGMDTLGGIISGAVTTLVGLDLATLKYTGVTTAMSFRSTDTAATMRHSGQVRIGSQVAPTQALDVTGSSLVSSTSGFDSLGTIDATKRMNVQGSITTVTGENSEGYFFIKSTSAVAETGTLIGATGYSVWETAGTVKNLTKAIGLLGVVQNNMQGSLSAISTGIGVASRLMATTYVLSTAKFFSDDGADFAGGANTVIHYDASDLSAFAPSTYISLRSLAATAEMRHVGAVKLGVNASPAAQLDVEQTTLGNAVLNIESTATNDDVKTTMYQNRVATTDATVTTIHTVAIPASTSVMIRSRVRARRTGGAAGTAEDSWGYVHESLWKNVAGTATQVGITTPLVVLESQILADVTHVASGGNMLVRVTGTTNNNITWHADVTVSPVGT